MGDVFQRTMLAILAALTFSTAADADSRPICQADDAALPDEWDREETRTILDPNAPDRYLIAARVARCRDDDAASEKLVDRALALAPGNADALFAKGEARRAAGDIAGALDYFGRTIAARPGDGLAHLNRGIIYIAEDRDGEARADIDAALKAVPNHPGANYIGALLLAREMKFGPAMEVLERRMAELEEFPPALYLMGVLKFAHGQLPEAQARLKQFLARSPDSVAGRKLLADTYLRTNATEAARTLLVPLARDAPDDADIAAMLRSVAAK